MAHPLRCTSARDAQRPRHISGALFWSGAPSRARPTGQAHLECPPRHATRACPPVHTPHPTCPHIYTQRGGCCSLCPLPPYPTPYTAQVRPLLHALHPTPQAHAARAVLCACSDTRGMLCSDHRHMRHALLRSPTHAASLRCAALCSALPYTPALTHGAATHRGGSGSPPAVPHVPIPPPCHAHSQQRTRGSAAPDRRHRASPVAVTLGAFVLRIRSVGGVAVTLRYQERWWRKGHETHGSHVAPRRYWRISNSDAATRTQRLGCSDSGQRPRPAAHPQIPGAGPGACIQSACSRAACPGLLYAHALCPRGAHLV